MKIPNTLGLEIEQLELPFMEEWFEQMGFQMEIDDEASNYLWGTYSQNACLFK